MKRLILDYYRRWALVLALAAAFAIWLGGFIARHPDLPFEFWDLLLAMWTGAAGLNFDFQRGALRPMAVLPLSGRQLGRSWWLATVPIPAVAMSALLFLGAEIFCHLHPGHSFPARPLVLASLFTLVWQGVMFTMIINAARGFGANKWEFMRNSFVSVVAIVVFFGSMILCLNASKSVLKSAILLGAGGLLTIVGWAFAERFDARRAGLYLGRVEQPSVRPRGLRLTPLKLRSPSPAELAAAGPGGFSYLLGAFCLRSFLTITALVVLLGLLFGLQKQFFGQQPLRVVWTTMGAWLAGWVLVFNSFLPMMRHVRFLRTLPFSVGRLAAVMVGLVVIPFVALTALMGVFAWLFLGAPVAIAVLDSCALILASVALCVFFAVWRGIGVQAYALLLVTMFGSFFAQIRWQMSLHQTTLPLGAVSALAVVGVLLAFVLTRLALIRGCGAYRIPANPPGMFPMGARN